MGQSKMSNSLNRLNQPPTPQTNHNNHNHFHYKPSNRHNETTIMVNNKNNSNSNNNGKLPSIRETRIESKERVIKVTDHRSAHSSRHSSSSGMSDTVRSSGSKNRSAKHSNSKQSGRSSIFDDL